MAREVRTRLGVRLTVLLTLVVAVLSMVTGIANIGSTVVFGPLGPYVPTDWQTVAGFTGTLTGFLMLGSALGLRRRLRVAWYSAMLLLPLTALQGVLQASQYSLPLIVLSLVSLPVTVLNRKRFDRQVSLSTTQIAAALALAGVQVYGTVGTYALRDEFGSVNSLLDAFYFTIVTASTVGYGDLTATTQVGRLFAMSVVVLGVASFGIALSALLGPAIEARFARALGRMTESQLDLKENHVLVLGYGELTEPILNELADAEVDFLVITPEPSKATELGDRGFDVITADPSDEEPLERARIADARAVVAATNNDAEDALSVLTARELNPEIRIVAAATDRENVDKLRRAGADAVISPAVIGGHLLVESALGSTDSEQIADRIVGGPIATTSGDEDGDGEDGDGEDGDGEDSD